MNEGESRIYVDYLDSVAVSGAYLRGTRTGTSIKVVCRHTGTSSEHKKPSVLGIATLADLHGIYLNHQEKDEAQPDLLVWRIEYVNPNHLVARWVTRTDGTPDTYSMVCARCGHALSWRAGPDRDLGEYLDALAANNIPTVSLPELRRALGMK